MGGKEGARETDTDGKTEAKKETAGGGSYMYLMERKKEKERKKKKKKKKTHKSTQTMLALIKVPFLVAYRSYVICEMRMPGSAIPRLLGGHDYAWTM